MPLLRQIENDLLPDFHLLEFDPACAKEFGKSRGKLHQPGISVKRMDLIVASVGLVLNLPLVTHNAVEFHHLPDLRLEDWLIP